MSKTQQLNAGQQAAANGFFEFLLNQEQNELVIAGAGGVGKTFLMGYMIDTIMPRYFEACKLMGIRPDYDSVVMTATTNKAAEVLTKATGRTASTIHSLLRLVVKDDYSTGRSTLTRAKNWEMRTHQIIFVDEASIIDSDLLRCIREGTMKCKIVFVGDLCQLPPVMEAQSPVFSQNIPTFELTEPMRNAEQPALMAICQQLRDTVKTGVFSPLVPVPGVIDYVSADELTEIVDKMFVTQDHDARILGYTNNAMLNYNGYIRYIRHLTDAYTEGEVLINNSVVQLPSASLTVEQEVTLTAVAPSAEIRTMTDGTEYYVRVCSLENSKGERFDNVDLPEDRDHIAELLKYYKSRKNWSLFFFLKNTLPDLRPRDAQTVHKSQGSTYSTVIIDLENISECRNPDLVARLLYVAFTRAKTRIIMYGKLADKFGGVACGNA